MARNGFPFRGADDDLETWVIFELRQHFRCRENREGIHIARHQSRQTGSCIGNNLESGLFQFGWLAPIGIIADQGYGIALDPLVQLEGARSDRVGLVAISAFRRNHSSVPPAQIEEHGAGWALEGHFDGVFVLGNNAFDRFEQGFLRVDRIRPTGPIKGEDYVFCIKNRCRRGILLPHGGLKS